MALAETLFGRVIWEFGRAIVRFVPRGMDRWRFGRFFGPSAVAGNAIFAVVDPYSHPTPRTGNRYIKRFLGRKPDSPLIGEDDVLGVNVVRLVSYTTALFSTHRVNGRGIPIVTDQEVENRWDSTFICFGSSDSNVKTFDIESLPRQSFYLWGFDANGWRCIKAGSRTFSITGRTDYGIILRMRNPHHPEHWIFVCAGLGEWGTTGSAYYLFDRWKNLYKLHGDSEFFKVVAVDIGSDESAREVYSVERKTSA